MLFKLPPLSENYKIELAKCLKKAEPKNLLTAALTGVMLTDMVREDIKQINDKPMKVKKAC
ncbi:MAG: hypothetical protein N3D84_02245 [Candidatus Woesearchaeota archaeon]|nr:hypothetical protein [Candidatus Woesearchaeota archaeon]